MPGEGGEDAEWAHLTPERADGCLSHALLEAATRGQALTSYQGHRNRRLSELRLAASSPGRAEKGAGNGAELGLWTWTWVQILDPPLRWL